MKTLYILLLLLFSSSAIAGTNSFEVMVAYKMKGKPPVGRHSGGSCFMRFPDGVKHWIYDKAQLSDDHVTKAELKYDKQTEALPSTNRVPQVVMKLSDDGHAILKKLSSQRSKPYERLAFFTLLPYKKLVMVEDYSNVINSVSITLTGNMTPQEAQELVKKLNETIGVERDSNAVSETTRTM